MQRFFINTSQSEHCLCLKLSIVFINADNFYLISGLACRTHLSVDNVADLCFHHTHDVLVHANYSMVSTIDDVVVFHQHMLCLLLHHQLHVDALQSHDDPYCRYRFCQQVRWRLQQYEVFPLRVEVVCCEHHQQDVYLGDDDASVLRKIR